jgi:hypothetical protein
MVARVTHAETCEPQTLHMTRLDESGAKIERRLIAGYAKRGGVIRLWPDDMVTMGLAIAEGIETALSAAHVYTPIWSCIDAGNLSTFPVLPGIESLVIFADHDDAGLDASRACARRWRDAGREVRIRTPREHRHDVNDITPEDARHAVA